MNLQSNEEGKQMAWQYKSWIHRYYVNVHLLWSFLFLFHYLSFAYYERSWSKQDYDLFGKHFLALNKSCLDYIANLNKSLKVRFYNCGNFIANKILASWKSILSTIILFRWCITVKSALPNQFSEFLYVD